MTWLIGVMYVILTVGLSLGPFFVLGWLYGRPGHKKVAPRWWHLAAAYGAAWGIAGIVLWLGNQIHDWALIHIYNSHEILNGILNGSLISFFILAVIFLVLPIIFHKRYKQPRTVLATILTSCFALIIISVSLFIVFALAFNSFNYVSFP